MMNKSNQTAQASDETIPILRLLQLIEGAIEDSAIGEKRKDAFMVHQFEHLKSTYF